MSKITDIINNTHELLRTNDDLLRLLVYEPTYNPTTYKIFPHPLERESIITQKAGESDDAYITRLWDIYDKHILKISKDDDMNMDSICRLYVYAGKTRPTYGVNSRAIVKQEIVIDLFVHTSYNIDSRMDEINDQLNHLMIGASGIGIGKVDIYTGYEFSAPKEYTGYRNIYEVVRSKR